MSLMLADGSPCKHDDVGRFTHRKRADFVQLAEKFSAVGCCDVNGFERREACFHEQFDFALIAEAGDDAAVAGRIESGEQQAALFYEFAFEFQFLFEERWPVGVRRVVGNSRARLVR